MLDTSIRDGIAAAHPELTAIRRDIHAHPELGMDEHRTAALVAETLRGWGVPVTENVGKLALWAPSGVHCPASAPSGCARIWTR